MTDKAPVNPAMLPVRPGTPVYAVEDVCACGSQCFGCPTCGSIRCLHCDPVEVAPEREPDCHVE